MIVALMVLVVGLVLLSVAADQFVLGAARIALIRHISPLVVGVVIIGFGTSLPEMLVSAIATAGDEPEIAIGNITGSNIANLSLLLGIGALIVPISVKSTTVKREAPITVAAMMLFAVLLQNGMGVWEGVALLAAMVAALVAVNRGSRQPEEDPLGAEAEELTDPTHHTLGVEVVRTVLGLAGTVASAQLLLWSAVEISDRMGWREGFVGTTLVAVGTSLPELVTVVQSARRKETDLIVGNLLGSNLFNALAVGGVVGLIGLHGVDDTGLTTVAAVIAIVVSALATLAMLTRQVVTRWEGVGLVAVYAVAVPLLI